MQSCGHHHQNVRPGDAGDSRRAILSPASPHLPSGQSLTFLSSERQSRQIPMLSAFLLPSGAPPAAPCLRQTLCPREAQAYGANKGANVVGSFQCSSARQPAAAAEARSRLARTSGLIRGYSSEEPDAGKLQVRICRRRRATAASTRPLGARQGTSQMGGSESSRKFRETYSPFLDSSDAIPIKRVAMVFGTRFACFVGSRHGKRS